MSKRVLRDVFKLFLSIVFSALYLPHFFCLFITRKTTIVLSDVKQMNSRIELKMPAILALLFFLHTNRYFRSLFYFRIGPILSSLISWYRPGDRYFIISSTLKLGKSCLIAHPYATILNADEIGDNFVCRHCTTLGEKNGKRPVIGNNVTLGASVTIIGPVHIGDNVIIGAGSVVVKDIPNDCIVVGNPAKIIKNN